MAMTENRKEEIITHLKQVYNLFELPDEQEEISMFDLISGYNKKYNNTELIGGDWVIDNCPSPLKDLT